MAMGHDCATAFLGPDQKVINPVGEVSGRYAVARSAHMPLLIQMMVSSITDSKLDGEDPQASLRQDTHGTAFSSRLNQ